MDAALSVRGEACLSPTAQRLRNLNYKIGNPYELPHPIEKSQKTDKISPTDTQEVHARRMFLLFSIDCANTLVLPGNTRNFGESWIQYNVIFEK